MKEYESLVMCASLGHGVGTHHQSRVRPSRAHQQNRVILSGARLYRAESKDLVFPLPKPPVSPSPHLPKQALTHSEKVAPHVTAAKTPHTSFPRAVPHICRS